MTKCTLTPDGGGIAIKCPYDPGFVADLKSAIPHTDRRYKPESKQWIVTPSHGATLQNLCNKYFNELPLLPTGISARPTITQKIIEVKYIGATKDRGADERSAYGWYQEGWNVIFSESVLRSWFDAPSQPDEQPNLYSVLGAKRNNTSDEIKAAFRRMAFQWHPDRCKEPNAHEQFIAIQHAYDILSKNRERYDAGLALEASLRNGAKNTRADWKIEMHGYRSPLRCGLIMCEGVETLGKFQVRKIFAWQDITDSYGRVLVVSWKAGDDHFSEVWA
jgi:hypothetical protein